MFFLQAADTKSPGGIEAAMRHYHRMFAANGARSACLYHGPAGPALMQEGLAIVPFASRLALSLVSLVPPLSRARAQILAAAGDQPIVAIVHSDLLLGPLRRLFPRLTTVTPCHSDKFTHKADADYVVTLNPKQHDLAREALHGRESRIHMLGNPFVAPTRPAPPVSAAPVRRIVFCARFVPFKDPMTLLRAYGALTETGRPALVLYGDGPLLEEAKAFAASHAIAAAFAGWTGDPWRVIGPDDLLVLPSVWEGLPYLLQEALAHHVPVVASDIAGNRAALNEGEFGALFRTGDADDLTRALAAAIAMPQATRAAAVKGAQALDERYGAAAFFRRLSAAVTRRP